MNVRNRLFLGSALVSTIVIAQPVFAQSAEEAQQSQVDGQAASVPLSAEQEDDENVIVVTGFRASLESALDRKRNADGFVDGVDATDMGQFASENVGDAIFGLPGVDIDFSEGEADSINIVGLGAEYNQVQVNGASLGAVNDSGSFGVEGAQTVGGFSTALLSGVEVFKSARADRVEGALGGVVNMRTWKPLNFRETRFVVNVQPGYQAKNKKFDGKANVLFGKRMDSQRFGFVVGGAYEIRDFRSDKFTTNGGSVYTQNYGPAAGRETVAPGAIEFRVDDLKYTRINGFGAVQWEPFDDFKIGLDATYTHFDRERSQTLNSARFAGGWAAEDQTIFEAASYAADPNVTRRATAGVWLGNNAANQGSRIRTQSFHQFQNDETYNANLTLDWKIASNLRMDAKLSYSRNRFGWEPGDHGHVTYDNNSNVLWTYFGPEGLPAFYRLKDDAVSGRSFNSALYPDFDINDQSTWDAVIDPNGQGSPDQFRFFGTSASQKNNVAKGRFAEVNFKWRTDWPAITSINFGARYTRSDMEWFGSGIRPNPGWYRGAFTLADAGFEGDTPSNFLSGDAPGWARPDWAATIAGIFQGIGNWNGTTNADGPTRYETLNIFDTSVMDSYAGYVLANVDIDDRLTGNVGVRYVYDDFSSTYLRPSGITTDPWVRNTADGTATLDQDRLDAANDPANFIEIVDGREKGYFLPSANFRLEVNEDLYLRLAASRTMARAPSRQTRSRITILDNTDDDDATFDYVFSGTNPRLKPTLASAIDLGLEWYFSRTSLFNIGLHYKELQNVRSTLTRDRFDVTDYNPVTREEISGDIRYRFPAGNGSGAVYVAEVGMLQSLDFLPGFLTHTGYSVNYTYTNNNVTAPVDGGGIIKLNAPSKHAVNTQFYYDDGRLNARAAYNWRSKRIANRGSATYVTPYDDVRESLNVSLGYKFNDQFRTTFQVQNVLDSRNRRYAGDFEDMTTSLSETGRRFLFGLHWKL